LANSSTTAVVSGYTVLEPSMRMVSPAEPAPPDVHPTAALMTQMATKQRRFILFNLFRSNDGSNDGYFNPAM
jgi:hypothetical protein